MHRGDTGSEARCYTVQDVPGQAMSRNSLECMLGPLAGPVSATVSVCVSIELISGMEASFDLSYAVFSRNSGIYNSNEGGSVAEWLACWTQAQKGPGSNRSRDAVG